jgi:ribosomal-protein-serine acetyltransferase
MFRRTVAPGIELRLFELHDAEPVFATVERNRAHLREWLPWVDLTYSPAEVRDFITKIRAQFENNQGPQCGLWIDGKLAGGFGCHPIDRVNRTCSIGYWIEKAHTGKGIITKCCATMLDYLFNELALHRVVIQCGTGNHRSCAIPQRLGFTREGVARQAEWVNDHWLDLVVWSMLEEEWKRRSGPYFITTRNPSLTPPP